MGKTNLYIAANSNGIHIIADNIPSENMFLINILKEIIF